MDVPSWHPANGDAQVRQLQAQSGATSKQRTEFKLMVGSTADTSTDAGRELFSELTRGADGGSAAVEGRGFFDSSDRLYLQEQRRLERERVQRKRDLDHAELQKFRSTALKVQAQKAVALVATVAELPEKCKTSTPAVSTTTTDGTTTSVATVRIKAKKRSASASSSTTSTSSVKVASGKPAKQRKRNLDAAEPTPPTTDAKSALVCPNTTSTAALATTATTAASVSLLVGYSSSDSDSDSDST